MCVCVGGGGGGGGGGSLSEYMHLQATEIMTLKYTCAHHSKCALIRLAEAESSRLNFVTHAVHKWSLSLLLPPRRYRLFVLHLSL